jgi:hypothetical protein
VQGVLRKVDRRLPGKENSNSMTQVRSTKIISMIEWIRNSRLSIKYSLSGVGVRPGRNTRAAAVATPFAPGSMVQNLRLMVQDVSRSRFEVHGSGFSGRGLGLRK